MEESTQNKTSFPSTPPTGGEDKVAQAAAAAAAAEEGKTLETSPADAETVQNSQGPSGAEAAAPAPAISTLAARQKELSPGMTLSSEKGMRGSLESYGVNVGVMTKSKRLAKRKEEMRAGEGVAELCAAKEKPGHRLSRGRRQRIAEAKAAAKAAEAAASQSADAQPAEGTADGPQAGSSQPPPPAPQQPQVQESARAGLLPRGGSAETTPAGRLSNLAARLSSQVSRMPGGRATIGASTDSHASSAESGRITEDRFLVAAEKSVKNSRNETIFDPKADDGGGLVRKGVTPTTAVI